MKKFSRALVLLSSAFAALALLILLERLSRPPRPALGAGRALPAAAVPRMEAPHSSPGRSPLPPQPTPITSSVVPGMPIQRTISPPVISVQPPPPPVAGSSAPPPSPGGDPLAEQARKDADSVRLMLRDFRTRVGGNPVGTNAEIMKAVMGGNPFQARFGPPPGQSISPDGELLDRWGRPYFFHALSENSMEIRSAGADGILWNSDDVIAR
ncbi:MAG: hypothetical protein KGS60_00820 [Verrucomicrobia bacterium]|nr:hypothetical protein [Verrucomicrobiota bacterium]